jgi:hypothetical protein
MKKVIFAIMTSAALTFSCDSNRTSERDDDYDDGVESEETLEPSTEEADTTSTWDQDRDRDHDDELNDRDLDDDKNDVRHDTVSTRDDGTLDDQK